MILEMCLDNLLLFFDILQHKSNSSKLMKNFENENIFIHYCIHKQEQYNHHL